MLRNLPLRAANLSFVVLFVTIIGLLLWLSREYHLQFDWTAAGRNSLSEASATVLSRLPQPIRITAYAGQDSGLRKGISELVGRYQRHKADIVLDFVDPGREPTRARAAGIQHDGEMVVEYAGSHDTLRQPNEAALTNLLTRLGRSSERWIVFLSGHGERSPDRQAQYDLSSWATHLNQQGLKTRSLNLAESRQIPDNTAVLVIAAPRTRLLPGEAKTIETYIEHGGNLLWLGEPGGLNGLERVAEKLGVEFQQGLIVDPLSQALTGAAANFVVATKYGTHPAVQNFELMTLFPDAVGIQVHNDSGWQHSVLIDTSPKSWSETGSLNQAVSYQAGSDIPGPLNLMVALTRPLEQREQRVIVVGDGDFLSNAYIGKVGNLDLGMNLVNWVSGDDSFVNIPPRTAPDLTLNLSQASELFLALSFLVLLPLAMIGAGVGVWWVRRRR